MSQARYTAFAGFGRFLKRGIDDVARIVDFLSFEQFSDAQDLQLGKLVDGGGLQKIPTSGAKSAPEMGHPAKKQVPPCSLRSRVGMTRIVDSLTCRDDKDC
jgi:hypothetical protein